MLRFRQMTTLQKFASVHASIHNHFSQERHLVDRQAYKTRHSAALAEWQSFANERHSLRGELWSAETGSRWTDSTATAFLVFLTKG